MATTEHEIESFSKFAKSQLENRGSDTSLDELFDEWRIQNPPSEDLKAIQSSIRDMDNGETGRSFDDFSAEFRKRNNIADN